MKNIIFYIFFGLSIGLFIGVYQDFIMGMSFKLLARTSKPEILLLWLLVTSLSSVICASFGLYYLLKLKKLERQIKR